MTNLLHQTTSSVRLRFIAVTDEIRQAVQQGRDVLGTQIGTAVPEGWPEFPEAFERVAEPSPPPWQGYLFLLAEEPSLVGNGGFVAAPDGQGEVEIGYEIAPAFRNQGYATEAAQALVQLAFRSGARAVIAHSLAGPNASNAVMRKAGMTFIAPLETGAGPIWRYRIALPSS